MNTGTDEPVRVEAAPHEVAGLTLTSSIRDANSGKLTQAKGNVHLSNQNQIQVSVAVIPPGTILQ